MKKTQQIHDGLSQERIEEIQIFQARMINQFKQTETWDLIKNILNALKKKNGDERRNKMRTQASRETCLYYTGVEDGIDMVFEEIDKVEYLAEMIRKKKEVISQYQEAGI